MVWCDVMWCGVVLWCGAVWCRVVWCCDDVCAVHYGAYTLLFYFEACRDMLLPFVARVLNGGGNIPCITNDHRDLFETQDKHNNWVLEAFNLLEPRPSSISSFVTRHLPPLAHHASLLSSSIIIRHIINLR